MYTTLEERARAQEKALLRLQDDLVERGLGGVELTPVGVPKQETAIVVGRVCCEAAEGRINKASVVLEGTSVCDNFCFSHCLLPFFPYIAVEIINHSHHSHSFSPSLSSSRLPA
jgi:hypothetical protein